MTEMAGDGNAEIWSAHLSRYWMELNPDACGYLYVDGHVSVYHGGQTKLPRRYVSRQRLCLRGVSNYWVNDILGRPFFIVEKQIDAGLLVSAQDWARTATGATVILVAFCWFLTSSFTAFLRGERIQ
jgi:prepilin-type processing-associated H-X9-DG protein